MALVKAIVDLPLLGGVREDVDQRVLPAGQGFAELVNYEIGNQGALRRRQGFTNLPQLTEEGAELSETRQLASAEGELLAVDVSEGDGPRIYGYSPARGLWSYRDRVAPCSVSRTPILRDPVGVWSPNVTVCGDLLVYTWLVFLDGVYQRVVDANTGTTVRETTRVLSNPLVVYVCCLAFPVVDQLALLVVDGNAPSGIQCWLESTVDWQLSAPTIFGTCAGGVGPFDLCKVDEGRLAVAYVDSAAPNQTVVEVVNVPALTIAGTNTTTAAAPIITNVALGTNATANRLALYEGRNTAVVDDYWYYNLATMVQLSWGQVFNGIPTKGGIVNVAVHIRDDNRQYVFATAYDSAGAPESSTQIRRRNNDVGLFVGGSHHTTFHERIATRPFEVNGLLYVWLSSYHLFDETTGYKLICLDERDPADATLPAYPQAWFGMQDARWGEQEYLLPQPQNVSGDRWTFPAYVYQDAIVKYRAVDRVDLDFAYNQAQLWRTAQASRLLALSGGGTHLFDGQCIVEAGFLQAPAITGVSWNAGGNIGDPASVATQRWQWVAVYEWRDARGNIHRSEPSLPYEASRSAGSSGNAASVGVKSCTMTRREHVADGLVNWQVRLVLYRSTSNASSPITYYRTVSSEANSGTACSVIVGDTTGDSDLVSLGYGTLYTSGGVLENNPAPPSRHICSHKGRLWAVSADDDRAVWFTKSIVAETAPEWSAALQVRLDDSPDGITAVVPLDDKLVILTPTRVYYVVGEGPADTGIPASGFSAPYLVTASAGCVDVRSVVSFDGGVVFQSKQGLVLLSRSLELVDIGSRVRDTVAAYTEIRGAAHDARRRRLLWLGKLPPAGGEVSSPLSEVLIYDYRHDAWMTWTTPSLYDEYYSLAMHDDEPHLAWLYVQPYASDDTNPGLDRQINDGLVQAPARIVTPWFRVGAISGYQRVWRVKFRLRKLEVCTLTVEVYINHDEGTVVQTSDFNLTTSGSPIIEGQPYVDVEMHLKPEVQKCSTIRFVLTEDGAGDEDYTAERLGAELFGVSFEVGQKQGVVKRYGASNRT